MCVPSSQLQSRVDALREMVAREPLLGRGAAEGLSGSLTLEDDNVVAYERRPSSRALLAPLVDPATEDPL